MLRNFEKEPPTHPLHIAAYKGDLTTIKKILAEKPSLINFIEQNKYGNSAVGLAAIAGHEHVVDYLLSQKADLDFNHHGQHPLHLAAERYQCGVMKLFHEKYKVDLLLPTKDGADVVNLFLRNKPPRNALTSLIHFGIPPEHILKCGVQEKQSGVLANIFWAIGENNSERLDVLYRIGGRVFPKRDHKPNVYRHKYYEVPDEKCGERCASLLLDVDGLECLRDNTTPTEFSKLLNQMIINSSYLSRESVFQFFDTLFEFFPLQALQFLEETESHLLNQLPDKKACLALLRWYWQFFQHDYAEKLQNLFLNYQNLIVVATFRGEEDDFTCCAKYFKGDWKKILAESDCDAKNAAWVLKFINDPDKIVKLFRENNYEVIREESRYNQPQALPIYLQHFEIGERIKILCEIFPTIISCCDNADIVNYCINEMGHELVALLIEKEFKKDSIKKINFATPVLMVLFQQLSPEKRSQYALSLGPNWIFNALKEGRNAEDVFKQLQFLLACTNGSGKFLDLVETRIYNQIAYQDDRTKSNLNIFLEFLKNTDMLKALGTIQHKFVDQPEFANFHPAATKLAAVAATSKAFQLPSDVFNHVLSFVANDKPKPLKLVECMRKTTDFKEQKIEVDNKGSVEEAKVARFAQKLQGQLSLWQKYTAPAPAKQVEAEQKPQIEQAYEVDGNKRRRLGGKCVPA